MNSRTKLKAALQWKEKIEKEIDVLTDEYLEEFKGEHLIWISDHAIIRYIERVELFYVPESTISEKDRVAKWFSVMKINPETFRNGILTLQEQEDIVRKRKTSYSKNGFRYLIKNLTLISIIPIKKKT